jgi:predicted MPP superfamily phosphohydrolase
MTPYEVAVPHLPRRLDGLRVLHLSDLHLHPGSDLAWQVPELVASVPHDLVCYTGDFIDCDDDIPSVAELLARLPHTVGAYTVLGNHDYVPFGRGSGANDVARLRAVLAGSGMTVLSNEARALFDGALYLVGVDDPATRRDDVERAFAGVPEGACTLVLAHSPDVVLRLGVHQPGLVLAGHTHGGQIRLPRVGALLTLSEVPRHLAMGLGAYRGVPLFVSRGIGYSSLNLRLGSPSEVAVLTLRAC